MEEASISHFQRILAPKDQNQARQVVLSNVTVSGKVSKMDAQDLGRTAEISEIEEAIKIPILANHLGQTDSMPISSKFIGRLW